jgi:DNA-binding response OmpR family regulator
MSDVRFQVGILGADSKLLATCTHALSPIATVTGIGADYTASAISALDLLLVVIQPPHTEGIRLFGRIRERYLHLKVLVLASGLAVNTAVELLKLGGDDLLDLPDSHHMLSRKVARVLLGKAQLTVDSPVLAPLAPLASRALSEHSKRACFRVRVPTSWSAHATFQHGDAPIRLRIEDLAVPTDQGPGGIGLQITLAAARTLPLDAWVREAPTIPLIMHISEMDIEAKATARRVDLPTQDGLQHGVLGVIYSVKGRAAEALLQRYWLELQRTNFRA